MQLSRVDLLFIIEALRHQADDQEKMTKDMQKSKRLAADEKEEYRETNQYMWDLFRRVLNYRNANMKETYTLE